MIRFTVPLLTILVSLLLTGCGIQSENKQLKLKVSELENEINEKNVVGFASFVVMCLFAVADLLTSVLADKDLIINEVVYNSFVWVTLGCFGISSFEKVKTK